MKTGLTGIENATDFGLALSQSQLSKGGFPSAAIGTIGGNATETIAVVKSHKSRVGFYTAQVRDGPTRVGILIEPESKNCAFECDVAGVE